MNNTILEKVRHELISLNGLKAFDSSGSNIEKSRFTTIVPNEDLIELDYENLIEDLDFLIDNLE